MHKIWISPGDVLSSLNWFNMANLMENGELLAEDFGCEDQQVG